MFKLVNVTGKPAWRDLAWPVVWLVISIIGFVLHPDESGHGTHRQLGLPPCPSVILFGRPCPACGLTTSWTHLLHGQFAEAFSSNAFGPLLYIGFTLYAAGMLVAYLKKQVWDTNTKQINWVVTTVLVAFLVTGFIRFATTRYPGPAVADVWLHR